MLDIGCRYRFKVFGSFICVGKLGLRVFYVGEGLWVELWLIVGLGFRIYEIAEVNKDS